VQSRQINLVTVKDGARFLTADAHGHALVNPGTHHVSDGSPAPVVEDQTTVIQFGLASISPATRTVLFGVN
jgi:hypothetical protein